MKERAQESILQMPAMVVPFERRGCNIGAAGQEQVRGLFFVAF